MRAFKILAIFALAACARVALADDPSPSPAVTNALWFPVGEEVTYNIYWGVFHVGQTHVTTSWTNRGDMPLVLIRFKTKTNGFVEKIYPVDDTIESLIEPQSFLPIYFSKKLSEGRYRCDEVTRFDYRRMQMRWKSNLNGRTKTYPIEPGTRDLVSMMYYLRRNPFTVGETNAYRVMADEKIYDLSLVTQAKEKVKLPGYGKKESFRIEPTAAFNGLFIRKGRMTFWVSNDDRRICTKIMAEVPVANVRLTLAEVKGPGDDDWVKSAAEKANKEEPDKDDDST